MCISCIYLAAFHNTNTRICEGRGVYYPPRHVLEDLEQDSEDGFKKDIGVRRGGIGRVGERSLEKEDESDNTEKLKTEQETDELEGEILDREERNTHNICRLSCESELVSHVQRYN